MGVRTSGGAETLSDDQVERFEQEGYLVIDDPCSPGEVDALVDEFDSRFRDAFHPGPKHMQDGVLYATERNLRGGYHWQRIMDAWKISDAARAVALAPAVLSALDQLYGRTPRPFQTLNFPIGTQQPAHSDSMFFSASPPKFMCGVWIALEDMDTENGPLVYYPGSHKLPTPTVDLVEQEIGDHIDPDSFDSLEALRAERNRQYSDYCRHLIETKGFEPSYGTIRKGQALIWSSNLLHGGAPQLDKRRTRHSQVSHYLFEDVRLHRPIWSEGDLVHWDYPVWVRDEVPEFSPGAFRDVVATQLPPDSSVAVFTTNAELVDLPGLRAEAFPLAEHTGREAVEHLDRMRSDGTEYMVVPPHGFWTLQNEQPVLQQALEVQHRPIFIDGAFCAIYDLR